MEIKDRIIKPYTEQQRMDFIVEQNHNKGYEIKETETELQAWGYTITEIVEQEKEKIAMLSLTRGDVFRGLVQARGITRNQIKELIVNNPELSEVERELALIDFEEALNFYRGNVLINTLGLALGITQEQLDCFFKTNDYTCLLPVEEPEIVEPIVEEQNG